MKSLVGKIGALALVAMAGVAVAACSSSNDKQTPGGSSAKGGERTGTVGLSLVPVAGITINNVHFVVTQGTTTIAEGDLPTPGTSDNFSFGLPLPVGTGYTLSLSGVSAESGDDITCTGSFGPFDVLANTSTSFSLTLTCVDNTNGSIITTVDVETEDCPRLVVDYVVAIPSAATLPDGTIAVAASARDLDNPSAAITYSWEVANPAVGDFTPAVGASTTFNCNDAGDNVIITVTADNGQCDTALSTTVSCVSLTCGNGIVEPELGETCDFGEGPGHPADPNCPLDCNRVCGDGVAEVGEECDLLPINPGICNPTTCELVEQVCGDGLVTPPEVCDGSVGVPAGSTCNPDCLGITGPVCGNGVLEAGETCDDGAGSALCSGQCEPVSTQACVDCENDGDCFEFVDNCNFFTGANRALCNDVMQCIQESNCFDGTGTLGSCYCGSIPAATCSSAPLTGPGSPDGACKDLILEGLAPVATSAEVLGLLTATGRPAGGAMARLNCQKLANGSACLDVCGFTAGGPAFP